MQDSISVAKLYGKCLRVGHRVVYAAYRCVEKIASNRKLAMVFLFTLTVLSGVFTSLITGAPNDPADDGAYYYDVGENIGEGRGFVSDIKTFWPDNWEDTEERGVVETYNYGVIMYPLFLSCVFLFDDSFLAIRLANTLVSGITVILLYLMVSRLFSNRIAFVSSIILICNPLFWSAYTNILSEAFYLFLSLIPFYILTAKERKELTQRDLLIAGLISGIAFLTRMVGLLIVTSAVIWLIWNKEFRKTVIYGIASFVPVVPWLILNKIKTDYFFPYGHLNKARNWPAAGISSSSSTLSIVEDSLRDAGSLGIDFPGIYLLFLLAPFAIIGILKYAKHGRISLIVIYIVVLVLFHLTVNYAIRYMLPLIPFLIPLAISSMRDIVSNFKPMNLMGIRITGKRVVILLICVIIMVSLMKIGNRALDRRDEIENNHNDEKYEWLTENTREDDIICSTQARHAHYFTGRQTLALAENLDRQWLDSYIDFYNISFIVLEEITMHHYEENSYLITFYDGNDTYELENHTLVLVHEEPGYGNDMLFYRVENA